MAKWIEIEDKKPDEGQKVWYYFLMTGVNRGTYSFIDGYDCFHGPKGFLCGDVTHWMPKGRFSILPPLPPD